MKKLNSFIPFWFLLVLPPLVIFLLAYNLFMASFAIIFGALMLKVKNPFDEYYKKYFKVFKITIVASLYIFALYIIPQLFRGIDIIYDNFIKHLEYNPYLNIFSFIYMVFIFVTTFKIIDKMINKKVLNDSENGNKIIISKIMTLFIIPYLFFMPSTLFVKQNKSNLDDFKGTMMGDKTSIVQLLKNLKTTDYISSYHLESSVSPYIMNIYVDDINKNYIKYFEMDAACIFYLINDVNEVVFHMNSNKYSYSINRINEVFRNIKRSNLKEINNRYTSEEMLNYIYLGRLDGYDVFDKNTGKEKKLQVLYTKNDINYYIKTTNINDIFIKDKNYNTYKLKEAMTSGIITTQELIDSNLEITIAGEENDENTN